MAQRRGNNTLITGRGSSKQSKQLALITNVNTITKRIYAQGVKPSLNGYLAHHIFQTHPKVKWVIHSHINLSSDSHCREARPGTLEDLENIKKLTKSAQIINLENHGVLILAYSKNPISEIKKILLANNCYSKNGSNYDICYNRFLHSTEIINRVKHLPKNAKILDLAGGTGEVSKQLTVKGYNNIRLADQSIIMMQEAKKKVPMLICYKYTMGSRTDIPACVIPYHCIIIRQAINYVAPTKLPILLGKVFKALASKGMFIFSTFGKLKLPSEKRAVNPEKSNVTHEFNSQIGNKLLHGQTTQSYSSGKVFYDLNEFYIFPTQLLVKELKIAGFGVITVQKTKGSGLVLTALK